MRDKILLNNYVYNLTSNNLCSFECVKYEPHGLAADSSLTDVDVSAIYYAGCIASTDCACDEKQQYITSLSRGRSTWWLACAVVCYGAKRRILLVNLQLS